MKNRAYKDLNELANTLKGIMECSNNITNYNYQDIKNKMTFIINHANNDLIDLIMTYLDDEEDKNTIYLIKKTKRNLQALEKTSLDRIDPSEFDAPTLYKFKQKIYTWVEYYYKIVADLMKNYYVER